MPLVDLMKLPPQGTLLGLDPGARSIGVAACDRGRIIASPVETIERGKRLGPALDRLFQIFDARSAVGVVVGLPKNMSGDEGPRAQSARALAHNILQRHDVPIAFWDERLSTAGVERTLLEANTRRARRAEVIDKLAATWILQGAIDRLREAG
ncbi:Holliday junction resolvase RuvX [bacterium]|nr:Holliday junction resolvase RuvX [bacterium]